MQRRAEQLLVDAVRRLIPNAAVLLAILAGLSAGPIAGWSQQSFGGQSTQALRPGYAGDQSCASCHKHQSLSYLHTAHHLTSQLPNAQSILGSFAPGANELQILRPAPAIGDPGVSYRMEQKGADFFQTALTGFPGQWQRRSERMGVVIGAGVRGQSYLYWQGDKLFELPVSYWTDGHRWINSPGLPQRTACI